MTAPNPARPASAMGRTMVALWLAALLWLMAPPTVAAVRGTVHSAATQAWATMFAATVVQAVPFLVLGVLLSAATSTLLSGRVVRAVLPTRTSLAVPLAGLAGAALPGCECTSVPIARGLINRRVAPAAALSFLLAAPAINPIVLMTTAVAFPGHPEIVVARFCASLVTSILMGWLWLAYGGRLPPVTNPPLHQRPARGLDGFIGAARHDLVDAGGFLVMGAMIAAAVNVFLPRHVLDLVASHPVAAVISMGVFAFLVAMCSEADAFVVGSLTAFSDTARLAFLVVGPVVDVKLVALQAGCFGGRFAAVFAPTTFVVALAVTGVVGSILL